MRNALTIALSVALAGPAAGQSLPARLSRFLTHDVGLGPEQLAAVERGEVVVKALATELRRDFAVFGIVAVDVPRDRYVQSLLDFPRSLRRPTQSGFGLFSTPADSLDIANLTFDRKDAVDAQRCEPGSCAFKLPAIEMRRIQETVDWAGADPQSALATYVRHRLVRYVSDYRANGSASMAVYDDRATVRSSDEFRALLEQSPYVYQETPALHQYLTAYPGATLEGAREALFWSVDTLKGLRPILQVSHVVLYEPRGEPYGVVAHKQIYASRYYEAGFNLVLVVDRVRENGAAGIYLIRLDRSRFDKIPRIPFVNVPNWVTRLFQDLMQADLVRQKARAEEDGQG